MWSVILVGSALCIGGELPRACVQDGIWPQVVAAVESQLGDDVGEGCESGDEVPAEEAPPGQLAALGLPPGGQAVEFPGALRAVKVGNYSVAFADGADGQLQRDAAAAGIAHPPERMRD